MKINLRDFFSTATSIASGELQGKQQAEQEQRQRAIQDYGQALASLQQSHQLEQEQRARATDPYRTGLSYIGQVDPRYRGQFATSLLGKIGELENAPLTYGPEAFNALAQRYPQAAHSPYPFPIPTAAAANNPWAQVGQMFAGGAAPAGGQSPGPTQPPTQPPAEQPTPAPFTPTPPPAPPDQSVEAQVARALPIPTAAQAQPTSDQTQAAQGMAGMGGAPLPGVTPVGPNPLGNQLTYQTNQQFPGQAPLPSPNMPFGDLAPALSAVQETHAGVPAGVGLAGGASSTGGSGAGPPQPRGQPAAEVTPTTGGAPAGLTVAPAAPPPVVAPSATAGVSPQIVPASGAPSVTTAGAGAAQPGGVPPNEFRLPGINQGFPFQEIDPATQDRFQNRLQTVLGRLLNAGITPEQSAEIDKAVSELPAGPYTREDAAKYNQVIAHIEIATAGTGAGLIRAKQQAGSQTPAAVRAFLAAVAQSPGRTPEQLRNLAVSLGMPEELATTLAAGDYSAKEIQNMLKQSIGIIYNSKEFALLNRADQDSLIQAAQGYADRLHVPIKLPAQVVLSMSPEQRARLDQSKLRLDLAGRAQDTNEARLQIQRDRLYDQEQGIIGRSGAAGTKGGLTPNAQLLAARRPYDEAIRTYHSLRAQKNYVGGRDRYDTAKNNLMAGGMGESQAIQTILDNPASRQPDDHAWNLANADKIIFQTGQHYQNTEKNLAAGLTEEGNQPQAPQQPGQQPGQQPAGQGAETQRRQQHPVQPAPTSGARLGVPGVGQGRKRAMIFTNPTTGEKRPIMEDPELVATRLLQQHPDRNLAWAHNRVAQMMHEATSGRRPAR